jgi:hypothetical protein
MTPCFRLCTNCAAGALTVRLTAGKPRLPSARHDSTLDAGRGSAVHLIGGALWIDMPSKPILKLTEASQNHRKRMCNVPRGRARSTPRRAVVGVFDNLVTLQWR